MKKDKLIEKIVKKVRTGVSDSKETFQLDTISIPVPKLKVDFLNDGVILIHDVPITKVGVQRYSDGNYLKTSESLVGMKTDFSPLSISHPQKHFDEMTIEEIKSTIVGYSNDGYYNEDNGKRYANFYLFRDSLEKHEQGKSILEKINEKKSVDVSIGFRVEYIPEKGTFDGKTYEYKDVAIQHDHTALLPNEIGRWSINEGVGIGAKDSHSLDAAARLHEEKNEKGESMAEDHAKFLEAAQKREDELKQKLADAEKKDEALQKQLADAQKAVEEMKKIDSERIENEKKRDAEERKKLSDAIADRVFKKEEEDKDKFLKFCEGLSQEKLQYIDSVLEKAVFRDHKLVIAEEADNQSGSYNPFEASWKAYTDAHRKTIKGE